MTYAIVGERAELLLAALARSRYFLRNTTRDITDDQAAACSTVSALCLGGLIKHVARTESGWMDFILEGVAQEEKAWVDWDESDWATREAEFRMLPGEALSGLLEHYERVTRRTEEVVASLPDLEVSQALPAAPSFEPNARMSARRVLMHLIAEEGAARRTRRHHPRSDRRRKEYGPTGSVSEMNEFITAIGDVAGNL